MQTDKTNSIMLHEVGCPICGEGPKEAVYELAGSAGKRMVVCCVSCRLMFVNPRISSEEIAKKYSGKSYFEREDDATGYRNYLQDRELHLMFFRRQLDELEARGPKENLMDVGCAGGFLIEEANQRGWRAAGVELSEFASEYARQTLGLNVATGNLRDASFPSDHYQAVVMDDVIEHFENPLSEILEVRRILKPGGFLLVHTPNAASPWRHLMGRKWVHLKPDEHLYYFDPATIRRLLEKAGLEMVFARSCSKSTNINYINGVIGKYLPGLSDLLLRLFSKHRFWWNPFPFRGGGMEVCAQKPASIKAP